MVEEHTKKLKNSLEEKNKEIENYIQDLDDIDFLYKSFQTQLKELEKQKECNVNKIYNSIGTMLKEKNKLTMRIYK